MYRYIYSSTVLTKLNTIHPSNMYYHAYIALPHRFSFYKFSPTFNMSVIYHLNWKVFSWRAYNMPIRNVKTFTPATLRRLSCTLFRLKMQKIEYLYVNYFKIHRSTRLWYHSSLRGNLCYVTYYNAEIQHFSLTWGSEPGKIYPFKYASWYIHYNIYIQLRAE